MPFASIIIPTYNRKELVAETIFSVTSQTFKDIEIIVVDDGSTDNTKEFLKDLIDKGDIIYQWQANAGRSEARNHGARISSGKFLMFLDSDDLLDVKAIENLYQLSIAHPASGVISGLVGFFTDNNKPWYNNSFNFPENITDSHLNADYMVSIGAYLIQREVFFATKGFKKEFEPAEDFEFAFVALYGTKFTWSKNFVVVNKRRHDENTDDTKLYAASYKTAFHIIKELKENKFPAYNEIKNQQIAIQYNRALNDCCYLNWKRKGIKCFVAMIGTKPSFLFSGKHWKLLAYLLTKKRTHLTK